MTDATRTTESPNPPQAPTPRRGPRHAQHAHARASAVALTLALTVTLIVALAAGCDGARPALERPHVLLLTVDTLRADHLGAYGYERATSPNFDRFAQDGLRFQRAYANAPETCPSFGSLLTGYLPHETQVTTNLVYLPDAVETLAEMLEAEGYVTAAFVSNFVLRAETKFDQGFEVYDDTMTELETNREMPERTARATADAAIAWLEEADPDEPFFLWVHFQDPHGPYTPPDDHATRFDDDGRGTSRTLAVNPTVSGHGGIPAYQKLGDHTDAAHYVARYDAEIRYFDEQLGRLLEATDRRVGLDRAFTVFTSDHGEGMGEHDYWFAHGENVYAGVLHVPLVIHGATHDGRVRGGASPVAVQLLDIVPTVRDAVGLEPLDGLRGQSLLDAELAEAPIFTETRRYRSLIRGRLGLTLDRKLGQSYLFDLAADPGQTREIGRGQPAVVEDFLADLERLENEDRLRVSAVVPEINARAIDQLRKLGYVDPESTPDDESGGSDNGSDEGTR